MKAEIAPKYPDYEPQIRDLVSRMTLEEKVGQMTQLQIGMITSGQDSDLQIDQEKLELDDGELEEGLKEMAESYQQPVEAIKAFYQQDPNSLAFFKHTLLEKKALKLIIDSNAVKEVDPAEQQAAGEKADDEADAAS